MLRIFIYNGPIHLCSKITGAFRTKDVKIIVRAVTIGQACAYFEKKAKIFLNIDGDIKENEAIRIGTRYIGEYSNGRYIIPKELK